MTRSNVFNEFILWPNLFLRAILLTNNKNKTSQRKISLEFLRTKLPPFVPLRANKDDSQTSLFPSLNLKYLGHTNLSYYLF